MAPSFLIAGATGNTGRSVVETLSAQLRDSTTFSSYRILALTRSAASSAAQKLGALPGVEIVEKNWVEITGDWLREHEVVRAFIASHSQTNQFAEEGTFHIAALQAGVKYVVRISTTAANVRPDFGAYYPRTHWAIETMLSTPEFKELQWTSLQPNIFTQMYLGAAVGFVKQFRQTGQQGKLALIASEDGPVGVIDPWDVGIFAAHLLLSEDTARHNNARYVLNGPEDITGSQIVKLVEQAIGESVKDVVYKDLSFLDYMVAAASSESKNVIMSVKYAPETAWNGECTAATTSKEVLEIAAPKQTPAVVFKSMLED